MVVVLLAVLAVIGAAAVNLGGQERINASAKGYRDRMTACANAARLLIWAELAKYGSANLQGAMSESRVTLQDGTILGAPAHYADSANLQTLIDLRRNPTPLQANDAGAASLTALTTVILKPEAAGVGSASTTAYTFVARCRDRAGRETEVEFTTGLMF